MTRVTTNMGLTAPASQQDVYSYAVNAQNLYLIDYHDHSPGRGTRLTGASIVPGSLGGFHFSTSSQLNVAGIQYSGTGGVSGAPAIQLPVTVVTGVSSLTNVAIPGGATHWRATVVGPGAGGAGGGGGGATVYGGGGGGGGAPGEMKQTMLLPLNVVSSFSVIAPAGGAGGNGGTVGNVGSNGSIVSTSTSLHVTTIDGWTNIMYGLYGALGGAAAGGGGAGSSGAGGTAGTAGTSPFVISEPSSGTGSYNTTAAGGIGGIGVSSSTINVGGSSTRSMVGVSPGGGGSGGGVAATATYGGSTNGWQGAGGSSTSSAAATGQSGLIYGVGGGGGAGGNVNASGQVGGSGGPGAVILEWFVFYQVNPD